MKIVKKLYYLVLFVLYYFFKVVQSNIYIAYDILSPRMHSNPGFIWVPLKLQSDLGIFIFSNLLSMTPGTLSVELSGDKKKLLVHFLYNNKKEDVSIEINKIQDKIHKLIN